MSKNVDQRVVQMKFDNQDFERRVKTTRQSLKDLKNDLNFDENVKQISNLQKAGESFDMSGMAASIENISNKFSALGVVGFTVLQNLTNGVLNFGKKIASSTIGQIISGGRNRALNLEQAQFQISGLGVDWEKKTEFGVSLKEQIDKAVSGTAYGLDAAAKVSGQLLASNIEAGSKEMQNALSGISGVAAMTNSTYEEIGHIFTTIAGNGKLMTEQLNQFAGRGLNVAATLAKKLNVTEGELRDMVSKGKVDFNTFAEAMNEAFGEQATKANDTYTGSLSNVKAALSRIGAEIQTPYLENMRQTFVALIPVLNGVKKVLGPLYEIASDGMVFIRKEAVKYLKTLAYLDKENELQIKGLQALGDVLKKFADNLKWVDGKGKTTIDFLKLSYKSIKSIFGLLVEMLDTVIHPISEAFRMNWFGDNRQWLHDLMGNIASGLQKVTKYVGDFVMTVERMMTKGKALYKIADGIAGAFGILFSIIKIAIKGLASLAKALLPVIGFFMRLVSPIFEVVSAIYSFFVWTDEAKRALIPLTVAFSNLKRSLSQVSRVFINAIKNVFDPFEKKGHSINDVYLWFCDHVGKALNKFAAFVGKIFNRISVWLLDHQDAIQRFGTKFGTVIIKITDFAKKAWDILKKFFKGFTDGFKEFRESVSNTVSSFGKIKTDGVKTFIERFKMSAGPLEAIGRFLATFWNFLKTLFSKIGPLISSVVRVIFDGMSSVVSIITDGLKNLDFKGNAASMLAAGGIIGGFIAFLRRLSQIEPTKLGKSITALFDTLSIKLRELKKQRIAYTLKQFAGAILELAIAMVILSSIDPIRLASSLAAISSLMYELANIMLALHGQTKTMAMNQKSSAGSMGLLILEMATSVLILAMAIKKLADLEPDKVMAGVVAVSGLLWELVGVIKVLSTDNKQMVKGVAALIAMAIAVRILVKAVVKLSALSWEALARGLTGTVALLTSLALAVKLISKSKGILSASIGIVLIAAALRLLVPVVKQLGSLDWETLGKAGAGIGGLLLIITLFSNFSKGGKLIANSVGLLIMAGALEVFVHIIKQFEDIEWSTIDKASKTIAKLLLMVAAFSRLSKGVKLVVVAVSLIVIAGALEIFVHIIKQFEDIDWSTIQKAAITIGGLLTMITLFSRIAKGLNLLVLSAGMVIFAVALYELVGVLALLSAMSWSKIYKGLFTISSMLIIMGVAAKVLGPSVVVIIALAGAMALFGLGTIMFGLGLAAISAGISAFVSSLSLIAKAFQFILLTILETIPLLLRIIAKTIVGLAKIITECAPAIVEAFVAVIAAALDAIIELAPKLGETIRSLLDTFLPILVEYAPKIADTVISIMISVTDILGERIPEVVFAVAKLIKNLIGAIAQVAKQEFNINSLYEVVLGFAAIAAIFVAVAYAAKLAQKSIVGVLLMVGVLAAITTMFLILATIDTVQFIALAAGISVAMLALSASMAIISLIPFAAAVQGIAGFAVFIAGLMAVLAVLGGLNQIPGFLWLLEEGTEVLAQLGRAIGEFVGNIIGGIMEGVSSGFPEIADNLSKFMTNLMPFIEGAKMITPEMFDGVYSLIGVILALTAATLLKSMNDFFSFFTGGTSFADLGTELCDFADVMIDFAEKIAPLDEETLAKIKIAGDAAKSLAEFAAAIPNSGGLASIFAGENDMDTWGKQLVTFGENLVRFSNAISPIKDTDVDRIIAASEAGKAIAEMASSLPNEGGVASWFAGENSLGTIAPQLSKFGKGLMDFAIAVIGFDDAKLKNVQAAVQAGSDIAAMASSLPNEGGVASWFAGENSLQTIAPQLADFGSSLRDFSMNVEGIKPKSMNAAIEATGSLIEVIGDIPNEGGVASWFSGDNTLSKFGEELEEYGPHLVAFYDSVKEIKGNKLAIAINQTGELIEAVALLKDVDGKNALKGLSEGVGELAKMDIQGLVDVFYSSDNPDKLMNRMQRVLGEFGKLIDFSKKIGEVEDNVDKNSLKNFVEGINELKNLKIDKIIGVFSNSDDDPSVVRSKLDRALATFGKLIDFSEKFKDLDTSDNSDNVKGLVKGLNAFTDLNVSKLIGVFTNSDDDPSVVRAKLDRALKSFGKLIDFSKKIGEVEDVDTGSVSDFVESFNELANLDIAAFVETFEDSVDDAVTAGIEFFAAIVDGIIEYKATAGSRIQNAIREIADLSINHMRSYEFRFEDTGRNYVLGIARGIIDNEYYAINAAIQLANDIIAETNSELGVNSPATQGIRSGKFWDLGMAKGITTYSSAVTKANENVQRSILDVAYDTMSNLSSIDYDDLDITPTIRPVWDMTDTSKGLNEINGLFGERKSFTLSASISGDRAKLLEDGETIKVETTNSDVVSAVNDLKAEVGTLKKVISNLAIYLDDDVLVGTLAPGIDEELGKRKRYYSRRG